MKAIKLSSLAFAALASVCTAATTPTQHRESAVLAEKASATGVDALDVEGGRVVKQAVRELILKRGYPISYEEPRSTNPDDYEDVTEEVTGKSVSASNPRILVPKTHKMSVSLDNNRGVDGMLDQIVAAGAGADPRARFAVRKDGAMYHVLPTSARDRDGNMTTVQPLLDTRITLPLEQRTAEQTFQAICTALQTASGQKVIVGSHGYFPYPGELTYSIGAENEVARDVLKRVLAAIAVERGAATWLLLYGKADDRFALNIMQIPETESKPAVVVPVKPGKATPTQSYDSKGGGAPR